MAADIYPITYKPRKGKPDPGNWVYLLILVASFVITLLAHSLFN